MAADCAESYFTVLDSMIVVRCDWHLLIVSSQGMALRQGFLQGCQERSRRGRAEDRDLAATQPAKVRLWGSQ